MSARLLYLSAVSALVISACATSQENPNYKYSTQYKAATPYQTASHTYGGAPTATTQPVTYTTTQQPVTYTQAATYSGAATTQPVNYLVAAPTVTQATTYANSVQTQTATPVVYQSARLPTAITQPSYTQASAPTTYTQTSSMGASSTPAGYTRVDQNCLRKETNRELLGGAIGGTVGAIAGKKIVGGTQGTLLGAAIGGTAGYGLGDKSINCDPVAMPVVQTSSVVTQPYPAQTYQAQTQPQYQQPDAQYGTTYPATSTAQAPVQMQPQIQVPAAPAPQTYTAPTDRAYGDTYGTPGYHAVMAAPSQDQQPQVQQQAQAPVYAAPQPTYMPPQPTYAPHQPLHQPTQATNLTGSQHAVVEGDTVYSLSKRLCVSPAEIQQVNGLDANFSIKLGQYIKLPGSCC